MLANSNITNNKMDNTNYNLIQQDGIYANQNKYIQVNENAYK